MTREEAKAWFKVLLKDEYAFNSADREAFAMAIKALEQEPCDNAVSRQAVIDIVDSYSESQSNEKSGIPLYKYCPQCGAKMSEIPTGSDPQESEKVN